MYNISDKILSIIRKVMQNWRVLVIAGGQILTEVKIQ